ncbi:MAG: sigma 54-interacting transcriptional regulator [Planctomycetes bacterium]|nr:sigma 54-interacting transcriptional regulator [Planctomycetota bacterium]
MQAADPIELLLPHATAEQRARARRWVTCARLIVDSGRRRPAEVVRLTLERARGELEAHTQRRVLAALLDLARHALYAEVDRDSFAWFGEPSLAEPGAWGVIEEYRDELPWLPGLPLFNESVGRVTTRLLDGAQRVGLGGDELRLWRWRALRANEGLEAGEAAIARLAEEWEAQQSPKRLEALAHWAEVLLDRGAVRAAAAVLEARRDVARSHARCARLLAWCRLLAGDASSAAATAVDPTWTGRLPSALLELREARPDWLGALAGRAAETMGASAGSVARPNHSAAPPSVAELRRSVGALAAACFALRGAGREELLEVDVAPALRSGAAEWVRRLRGSCGDVSSAEHEMVVESRPVVRHARAALGPEGSIQSASVRSIALTPVTDALGEVAGWIRFEFDHHLIPARERLARLGLGQRERVLSARSLASAHGTLPIDWSRHDAAAPEGPCAAVFRALVAELGMKTAQRRWWGFEVREGRARCVVEGGAAIAESATPTGECRALTRALRSAGSVRFDEPNAELAIAREAGSGLVLPIVARGALCGLLALESARRHDFPATLVERWAARARASGAELRAAQFSEWHRATFGCEVFFPSPNAPAGAWVGEIVASSRSLAPCLISGPRGSGKRVVARWLHFEGGRERAPFSVFACGDDAAWSAANVAAACDRVAGGSILFEDVEHASPAAQARLLAILDDPPARAAAAPRWLFTASSALAQLAASGALREDLCRRLARLELRVPSLHERRAELPRIVEALLARCSESEGLAAPRLLDEALALVWRQPWLGNMRELENFVFKLVLVHPGAQIDLATLERFALKAGIELTRRVPSRTPEPEWLRGALAATANLRGSINKTRAALYLGWDPDTLVARMEELASRERAGSAATSAARDEDCAGARDEERDPIAGSDPS